jgi:hypothetical protein
MVTPVVPPAFIVCAVSALYFAVDALCVRLLFRGCFGLGAIHGLRGVCPFSAPPPTCSQAGRRTGVRRPLLSTLGS